MGKSALGEVREEGYGRGRLRVRIAPLASRLAGPHGALATAASPRSVRRFGGTVERSAKHEFVVMLLEPHRAD
jgi:hypothetical protein